MNRIVFISRNYKGVESGGYKARIDTEDILASTGAVNIGLKRTFSADKVYDYFRNIAGIAHYMRNIGKNDIVVIQYPVKKYYRLLCRWARMRGARTITLVHDLGSFRRKRLSPEQEIKKFSLTDLVVAANDNTVAWLRANGLTRPIVKQVAWDFLSDSAPASGHSDAPESVLFVGNCKPSRNGYLYKIPESVRLNLYGEGGCPGSPNIIWHGVGNPDSIISDSDGRFGLVWYDSSLEHTEKGYMGDYICYNNPHKLSLYMRAGKPIIVWKGAGCAPFVKEEGIGICVDSLTNLPDILASVSDEEYAGMKANVLRVAERMRRGDFARAWLTEALEVLGARKD